MMERYEKLAFKRIASDPPALAYGMEHYPGCFTPTGIRDHHIDPVRRWCRENSCGWFEGYATIRFRSEEDLTLFMLRWG